MLFEQRLQWLRRELSSQGNIRTKEAATQLDVSVMTLWRDLKHLEDIGELRRVHGGALPPHPGDSQEPDFASKAALANEDRVALAKYAAKRFPRTGDCIAVEGGTTAIGTLPYLEASNLTIITNSLEALRRTRPTDTVLASGGVYRQVSHTFVGPQAIDFFKSHRSDLCFISATGFSAEEGLTDPNPLEIEVKRTMCEHSRKVVLLLDRSKFGRRSLARVVDLDKIDVLVTNEGVSAASLKPFRQAGIIIEFV